MIRIKADSVSITPNAVEAEVLKLEPRKDRKIQVLEIALKAVGDGFFTIYFNQEKICDPLEKNALEIDLRRILVDWELAYGDRLIIVFTDKSGATNTARYLIVYKEV